MMLSAPIFAIHTSARDQENFEYGIQLHPSRNPSASYATHIHSLTDEVIVREADNFHRALEGHQFSVWDTSTVIQTWEGSDATALALWNYMLRGNSEMEDSLARIDALVCKVIESPSWRDSTIKRISLKQEEDELRGVTQSYLPFQGSFEPSVETISAWIDNLKEMAIDAGRENVELSIAKASASERSHQFAMMFRSVIGAYCQFHRYEDNTQKVLFSAGRFTPGFQQSIVEQFFVVPDRSYRFFAALGMDFVSALRSGWDVHAEWGHVSLDSHGDIVAHFKPVDFFIDDDFVESEDVK